MKINGILVYQERVSLGKSLREMEELTKVSKSTLSRLEASKSIEVHITTAGKIAKALEKKVEDFAVVESDNTTK